MIRNARIAGILATTLALAAVLPVGALAAEETTKPESTTTVDETSADTQADEAAETDKKEDAKTQTGQKEEAKGFFAKITLDHSMVSLAPGKHVLLSATTQLPAGVKGTVQWESSDSKIAKVTAEGRVYAVATGNAVVYASIGTLKVGCRVSVAISPINYDGPQSRATRVGYIKSTDPVSAASLPLSTWDGVWNSVLPYFEHDDVKTAFAGIEQENKLEAGALAASYADPFKADFSAIRIDGDTVTLYKETQTDAKKANGEVAGTAKYTALASMQTIEGAAYIFSSSDEKAPYQYLMMYAPQIDEKGETVNHFYVLYGDDLEALKANDSWAPMMVAVDSTDAQVVASFLAASKE